MSFAALVPFKHSITMHMFRRIGQTIFPSVKHIFGRAFGTTIAVVDGVSLTQKQKV
jgi:hypothetical protein